jgi:Initiator Replication protein
VAAQAASLQATKFNERLKPYILGLRKHFAKIPVAEACKLRSGHARVGFLR